MIERTNLDKKDAACLNIVHFLQHATSRPTTKSAQTTMLNPPKMNFLPIPPGTYDKSTKRSTQWCHQVNEIKSGLEAERVQALGALCGLRSKKMLAAETQQEMHILTNEDTGKWIKDYVGRVTARARKRLEDAETPVLQKLGDTRKAQNAGLTNTEPENAIQERCSPSEIVWVIL